MRNQHRMAREFIIHQTSDLFWLIDMCAHQKKRIHTHAQAMGKLSHLEMDSKIFTANSNGEFGHLASKWRPQCAVVLGKCVCSKPSVYDKLLFSKLKSK